MPYYLQHQVWNPDRDDPRGLGGDQIPMALSSWNLLHAYSGDESIVADMRVMADYWLARGLTPASAAWPGMPYPYNLQAHGRYDGDMRGGPGVIQPDKAASFGAELLTLYKISGDAKYLAAAEQIATVLARTVTVGNASISPWPFRVDAQTGVIARSNPQWSTYGDARPSNLWAGYTSNWTGALRLFDGLVAMGRATPAMRRARRVTMAWFRAYPARTNQWGPFFEDIVEYSNTAINADTFAMFLLEAPRVDKASLDEARSALDWVERTLSNREFSALRVVPINEQTVYQVPGNSHTARHAATELLYEEKSGDASHRDDQVRRLNWATYMVDTDGKNRYPRDDIWLTDGYGDYVRHYLRAMAALPVLAPANQNHLLRTTSVIKTITYGREAIAYAKFDAVSTETLRLGACSPAGVTGGTLEWDGRSRVALVHASGKSVRVGCAP